MPGVGGAQKAGSKPRLGRMGTEGREGFLEEVTHELRVKQKGREGTIRYMSHRIIDSWAHQRVDSDS